MVPYWSMSVTLTQDPKERTKIIAVPRILGSVANFIVNLSTLALVAYFGNWIMVAIIFSLSELFLILTTFFGVKEKHTKKREKRQDAMEVIRLLKENRPLQLLLISFFLLETVNTIRNAFTIYFFKYNLDMPLAASLFLTVSSIATIVGSISSPIIAAKIGKKNTAIYGKIVMGFFTILIFFVSDNVVLVTIFNLILSIGMGASNIAQASMLADCVEYGEWKTGNRAEGMVFSLNIFKAKVAGAFGSALGAYALSAVGYVANAVQTPVALLGIKLYFTILPGILCLLALIPLFKYELTESRYLEILSDMRKNTFSG